MQLNNVYVGNNLDILKTFPDNSIDSVVTDPPYGLGKEPNAVDVLSDWVKESIKEDKEKELGIQTIFDFMEELEK